MLKSRFKQIWTADLTHSETGPKWRSETRRPDRLSITGAKSPRHQCWVGPRNQAADSPSLRYHFHIIWARTPIP